MPKIYRTFLPVEVDPKQHMIEVEYEINNGMHYAEIIRITRGNEMEIKEDDLPIWYCVELENECYRYGQEELDAVAEYMEDRYAGNC